jgi:LAS superfamily LD-carboxypeptidase LdcB
VSPEQLTGQVRTHIVDLAVPVCALHVDVATPFLRMRRAAASDGLELQAVSGFRDFARQLAIWNAKFSGARPVLDADGRPLDALALAPEERIAAILNWSALPGASRHHWGTDLDLIDAARVPAGYRVKLSADEFALGGPFAALSAWLEAHAARFGFFRPFRGVLSGVQPEPWHVSFAPLAENARRDLRPPVLRAALERAPLLGRDAVLARIDELHARYVAAVDWP